MFGIINIASKFMNFEALTSVWKWEKFYNKKKKTKKCAHTNTARLYVSLWIICEL